MFVASTNEHRVGGISAAPSSNRASFRGRRTTRARLSFELALRQARIIPCFRRRLTCCSCWDRTLSSRSCTHPHFTSRLVRASVHLCVCVRTRRAAYTSLVAFRVPRSVHLTECACWRRRCRCARASHCFAFERCSFVRLGWRRACAFAWCAAAVAVAVCVRCSGTSSLISDSTLRPDRRATSSPPPRVVFVMDTKHTRTQVVDLKTTYNLKHIQTQTQATANKHTCTPFTLGRVLVARRLTTWC